jgi:hypothetical protein
MGPIHILFGEGPLVHCIYKMRTKTLLRALGLVWEAIESGVLVLLNCHNKSQKIQSNNQN